MNNNDLNISLNLLRELYNININIINSVEDINTFVEKFHFHNAQTAITTDNINKLIANHDEIIYLTDSFLIQYMIFKINNTPIIIGPFCSMLLSSNDVYRIFSKHHINDISIKRLFLIL